MPPHPHPASEISPQPCRFRERRARSSSLRVPAAPAARRARRAILAAGLLLPFTAAAETREDAASHLVAALLGPTPLIDDLRALTDEIGGRPTGSEANRRAVDWGLERFRAAGVEARREPFLVPLMWQEGSVRGLITGDVTFAPRMAAMPYSTPTPLEGMEAPLLDGGTGDAVDFQRLGEAARGAFVLIETVELVDVPGLFHEYSAGVEIEDRAFAAGVRGVVYMGSRPRNVLHHHLASRGAANTHPMLVMERDAAGRALRLLRAGARLSLRAFIEVTTQPAHTSENVVAEIRGSARPEQFVVIGAHLDSWGIGTGALDNACNVALVIDLARQIQRLGLTPQRTIRFALFNGEELGLHGSHGYTLTHAAEMERHVMASSYDIGSGRISGFFINGREELGPFLERALAPVAGLGPFSHSLEPVVGTDNFDFMLQGVANLVANQESANYGPNYHAGTDTFDKVDQTQLRLNAAVAGAVTWGFANLPAGWKRHSRAQIQELIDQTSLGGQMRTFNLMEPWIRRERGRLE
jgi:hypothetical protein